MSKGRLTQQRIDSLKPRKKTLDIRDSVIRGFGVRVLASGRKSYFLHSQNNGKRVWQSIGDAGSMSLECAREQATLLLASRTPDNDVVPTDTASILFEDFADDVFRHYQRHWKPNTLKVNQSYYRNQILPWFRGCSVSDITRQDVQRWFCLAPCNPRRCRSFGTGSLGDPPSGRGLRPSSPRDPIPASGSSAIAGAIGRGSSTTTRSGG